MQKSELLKKLKTLGFRKKTLEAFTSVDRESFVPRELRHHAYEDAPLPIGHGQTISQPYTIAIMLEELDPQEGQKILEVGSGCGYVLALLSTIVGKKGQVIGLELSSELAKTSIQNTKGYKNVKVYKKDGTKGLPAKAPFDKILISAAPLRTPPKLIEQLKNDGILVAPIGPSFQQSIFTLEKKNNEIQVKNKIPGFVFVPLVEKNP
jgi:protein-L-isoaspartate(D-aspartate) O-methyltransferase